MKRILLIVGLAVIIIASSGCSRKSGCLPYDKKTGEYHLKKNKKPPKSGLFPKNGRF